MARLINLLPSALLVFLGAYAGTGKSFAFLRSGTVWLMSVLSGGVAIASVIVNDYFGECSLSCWPEALHFLSFAKAQEAASPIQAGFWLPLLLLSSWPTGASQLFVKFSRCQSCLADYKSGVDVVNGPDKVGLEP
jgi:hypothetical protein